MSEQEIFIEIIRAKSLNKVLAISTKELQAALLEKNIWKETRTIDTWFSKLIEFGYLSYVTKHGGRNRRIFKINISVKQIRKTLKIWAQLQEAQMKASAFHCTARRNKRNLDKMILENKKNGC